MTVYEIAAKLPSIDVLRDRSKALAALDAVIGGDFYKFEVRRAGEVASMCNGSGDEYDVVFTADGAFIRGNYSDSPMHTHIEGRLWPGLLEGLPAQFESFAREAAFCHEDGTLNATFVLWRSIADCRWHAGENIDFSPVDDEEVDPDGSWLLDILCDEIVEKFIQYAQEVHEIDLNRVAVEHVFAMRPLTVDVIRMLNPEIRSIEV